MGVFRKTSSVFTMGLVDFKSDKERVAASARKTKQQTKATKKAVNKAAGRAALDAARQNTLLREQNELIRRQNELLEQQNGA